MQFTTLFTLITLVATSLSAPLPTSSVSTSNTTSTTSTSTCPTPRIRKEIRSLSSTELKDFVEALTIMDTLSEEEGKKLYGSYFRTTNSFVIQHAIAVQDFRGDQGHFGPHFMTFHRALMFAYENSVLSIRPNLTGLPYWDAAKDSWKNGTFFNTTDYFFSAKWAGSIPGNKNFNYTVTDGLFPWRRIGYFNDTGFSNRSIFNGTALNGQLRSYTSTITNEFMTRFPKADDLEGGDEIIEEEANHGPVGFSEAQYLNCTNTSLVTTWLEWQSCIESIHGILHQTIGGVYDKNASSLTQGDMKDVTTSPNEILVFPVHHTNMDRNNLIWQRNMFKINESMSNFENLWGYPTSTDTQVPGASRKDAINANYPFTDILMPWNLAPKSSSGYTHEELLYITSPGTGCPFYIYDHFEN